MESNKPTNQDASLDFQTLYEKLGLYARSLETKLANCLLENQHLHLERATLEHRFDEFAVGAELSLRSSQAALSVLIESISNTTRLFRDIRQHTDSHGKITSRSQVLINTPSTDHDHEGSTLCGSDEFQEIMTSPHRYLTHDEVIKITENNTCPQDDNDGARQRMGLGIILNSGEQTSQTVNPAELEV